MKIKVYFKDTPETIYRPEDPKDIAANLFARQLLMPKYSIIEEAKKIIEENGGPIEGTILVRKLADIFPVTEVQMYVRLQELGLFSS